MLDNVIKHDKTICRHTIAVHRSQRKMQVLHNDILVYPNIINPVTPTVKQMSQLIT